MLQSLQYPLSRYNFLGGIGDDWVQCWSFAQSANGPRHKRERGELACHKAIPSISSGLSWRRPQSSTLCWRSCKLATSKATGCGICFPQLRGLGHSPTAEFYGLASLDEATAYLNHPLLGMRLKLCTGTVLHVKAPSLQAIFGSPDDMKFKSCMTLFSIAVGNSENIFSQNLHRWCDGGLDERTLELISS